MPARELLALRHDDPADLHAALLRAGRDPQRTLEAMRAGIGIDRIVSDVASALASGVTFSPALFLDGSATAASWSPRGCPPRWGPSNRPRERGPRDRHQRGA
jgi:hypothetical protein